MPFARGHRASVGPPSCRRDFKLVFRLGLWGGIARVNPYVPAAGTVIAGDLSEGDARVCVFGDS